MKPHDQIAILRNRHRARELKAFRELVATYFAGSELDANDVPMDWDGAQVARSRVNQMLPRVIQIVRAAGLGGSDANPSTTDPGRPLGRIDVLYRIFSARYGDGLEQEIFDLLDMALGVYESGRLEAFARTINPLHYLATAVGFVGRAPGRLLAALGIRRQPPRVPRTELARPDSATGRTPDIEDLIDRRLAAIQDGQAQRMAEYSRQLAELAERLDFAERMLAREAPAKRLDRPERSDLTTPV